MRSFILQAKQHFFRFRKSSKIHVLHIVPYFGQWESWDLIGKILKKELSAADDPLWRKSGAKTKAEYVLWSWNGCGMACLKMILSYLKKKEYPLVTLGKICMEYGGYKPSSKVNDLLGLFYAPFVTFIQKEFGLKGRVVSLFSVDETIYALDQGNVVIASVSPLIRNVNVKPSSKGGHLVLIVGYDVRRSELIFHNPSGDTKTSQEFVHISFSDFERFFANRGIIVHLEK